MNLAVPAAATGELAAAFLQIAVTFGLAALCLLLHRRYHKPYFGWWALAWLLYILRLGAIVSFISTDDRVWLYWHQVIAGWTALALLWAALVFSQQLKWRTRYFLLVLFPPLWSYVAIYRLDNFLLAAGPAVLFLSLATLWTAAAFYRYHRQLGSTAALVLGVTFLLWSVHHLDYPFLRARGIWNPWGYYLDMMFELATGSGLLLLVLDDLQRGLGALSALSEDLQRSGTGGDVLGVLLERPLSLAGVRGSAMYLLEDGSGKFVRGAGVCAGWGGTVPEGAAARAIERVVRAGAPELVRDWRHERGGAGAPYAYAAALPVLRGPAVTGALVIVGNARDPFAALDQRFLIALGQQVGAALESADLYRRLAARTTELERLAARMVQLHEEERRRLSRELHDETAQVFSAVRLQLGIMREAADRDLVPRLDRVLALVDEGIQSIRSVTNDLRPSLLDDLGLLPALRALVDEFADRTGLTVQLDAPSVLPELAGDAELALFRALQEGLSNVARHADAHAVYVSVRRTDAAVELSVRDDGRGLPADADLQTFERNGHMGLAGMRERITALGGTTSVRGRAGQGVDLTVRLPVTEVAR